jgi:ribosomal protein S18 acetylase RimI-like enzyme
MPQGTGEARSAAAVNDAVGILKVDRSRPAQFWRDVAALHRQEIHGGFLTSLNPRFLESIYRSIAGSKEAFLLAATDGASGRLLGFICGSTNTRKTLVHSVLHSGPGPMLSILPSMFSLHTVGRIFETIRYANGGATETLPRAEILNFCVDRTVQGRGIGKMLFAALRDEFRARGVKTIKIVTGESQITAQQFYHAVKARPAGTVEIHNDSHSVVFLYDIS